MFHVLDHADVVYSGDLSQATEFVIEHYGKKLDDAIRSGIRILYSDALHSLNEARRSMLAHGAPAYWNPIEDWQLD